MYNIKMSTDKTLVSTLRSPIYAGEKNYDSFNFIIPKIFGGIELKDLLIYVHYFLPGSTKYSEILLEDGITYNEHYLMYPLRITPAFTSVAGEIKMRIVITDNNDNIILKSSDTKVRILFPKECDRHHIHESNCFPDQNNYLERIVRSLEEDSHTHNNKNLLDSITEDDIMRIAALAQNNEGSTWVNSYIHTQNTPLDTWIITHNLNQKFVSVQAVSISGNTLIPDVEYISATACRLTFAKLVQGTAIIRK